jgi:hypothetical protein
MTQTQYLPFNESLAVGQNAELQVATLFLRAGYWVKWANSGRSQDLCVMKNDIPILIEVKDDIRGQTTGNIFVETQQGNPAQSSGLLTTEASIWVHLLGDMCTVYRAAQMRIRIFRLVHTEQLSRCEAGDNHNRGYVLRINDFTDEWWFDYRPLDTIANSPLLMGFK